MNETLHGCLYGQNIEELERLNAFFVDHRRVALAFSGGCDSSFLLEAAIQADVSVGIFIFKTPFQPAFELHHAREICKRYGISPYVLKVPLSQEVLENPPQRCYFCKRSMFTALLGVSRIFGYSTVIEGTNASDDVASRPGYRALQELGVLSPLRLCGLDKSSIRHYSALCGLSTAHRPSYACLATRIPSGVRITRTLIERVEQSERALFEMGYEDFRVRVFHDAARLELTELDMKKAVSELPVIREALQPYFPMVLIDTKVRE